MDFIKSDPNKHFFHTYACITCALTAIFISFLDSPTVFAQGGCGSVCIPLESIAPEQTQIGYRSLRLLVTSEIAEFNNFREGGSDIFNPGGNQATISESALFVEYGVSQNLTVSLMVPYVHKVQRTNKFGTRTASGIGDMALFAAYEAISPSSLAGPSVSLGLGVKFSSGSIEEPGGDQPRLPPAFQVGSGAFDIIPTLSYYQNFDSFSAFGNSFVRIPIDENKFGYKFGNEYELHLGIQYPSSFTNGKVEFLGSVDFLYAEHDTDSESILPARLRAGETVSNTGGTFLSLTPGLRFLATKDLAFQVRFFIAVREDWNGLRAVNVGQVAPDVTLQFTLAYRVRI